MTKWIAIAALGAAMIVGCDSMKKKDKDSSTTKPMTMSASGSQSHCSACDASKAK